MIAVSSIPAYLVWIWPTPGQLLWLALIGALASAIGFLVFGELPNLWTWAGGFLIIGSTVYIALREVRLRRPG